MNPDALPTASSPRRSLLRTLFPALSLIAVAGTGVLGGLLVTIPAGTTPEVERFVDTDEYRLWRVLIGALLATTVASVVLTVALLRRLKTRYPSARLLPVVVLLAVVSVFVSILSLVSGLHLSAIKIPGALGPRVFAVTVVVVAALFPAVAVIWVVRARVQFLAVSDDSPSVAEANQRLIELRDLRSALNTVLIVLSIAISLTVVVTGQLRNALVKSGPAGADAPVAYVLLYGAVIAALLGALYLPVYLTWQQCGARLIDALYPIDRTDDLGQPVLPDGEWETNRKRLSDLLTLGATGIGQFKTAFATLAPFLTSLLAYFLPTSA